MKRRLVAITLSMVLLGALIPSNITPSLAEESSDFVQGQALVTLALPSDADSPLINEGLIDNYTGLRVLDVFCFDSAYDLGTTRLQKNSLQDKTMYVSHVSADVDTDSLLEILSGFDYVKEVSPNYVSDKESATNDPLINDQWALGGDNIISSKNETNPDSTIGYKPEDDTALDNPPIVAVVDDGIDYTHEDLKDKMWVNPYSSLPGTYGYDCCNVDEDPIPTSKDDTHGTGVAGVIAANTNNNVGVAGVSGSAKLMALKLFDSKNERMSGSAAAEIRAYEYIYRAQTLGANIVAVNCSFGNPAAKQQAYSNDNLVKTVNAIHTKLGSNGALIVYSAGNETRDLDVYKYGVPFQYDSTYRVLVGATTYTGERADFSNYSSNIVDLMAPGCNILTTTPVNTFLPETYDADKRSKLCSLYQTFDSSSSKFKTYSDLFTNGSSALDIGHGSRDFYGKKSSGSVSVKLVSPKDSGTYAHLIFYDVTDLNIKTNRPIYASMDLNISSHNAGYWSHQVFNLQRSPQVALLNSNNRVYLAIDIKSLISEYRKHQGEYVYIDNLAISVNDPDTSQFGKYSFVNGTSFSAPMVSAAIARLSVLYPTDNALTRKEKIHKSVKRLACLTSSCITGGTLDISSLDNLSDVYVEPKTYAVKSVKLNKKSAKLKVRKKIKFKATISPIYATKKSVKWKVSNKKYASVTKAGVVTAKKAGKGHTVTVTCTAADGSKKKATCKIRIVK